MAFFDDFVEFSEDTIMSSGTPCGCSMDNSSCGASADFGSAGASTRTCGQSYLSTGQPTHAQNCPG